MTAILVPASAEAGLHIDLKTSYFKPVSGERSGRIVLDGSRVFMELEASEHGKKGTILFDAEQNRLTNLHHTRKAYMVMDENLLKDVTRQILLMREKMRQQIKQLPPGRREGLLKILNEGALAPIGDIWPRPEIRAGGEDEVIDGLTCRRYDVLR
ncbi:MAG: hypothetical protein AAF492_20390, partial [Verrucomicrobiota bacterium]